MLKLKKEKILVSLIAIVMVALVVGNVYSLATEENTTGTISLTQTNNTENTSTKNNTANLGAEVGSTNTTNNTNNTTNNTNTNNTTNNATNNTTNKTNTNSTSSSLPYAGSNTSIIFIVIALIVSAIYAYKKVSDYNV